MKIWVNRQRYRYRFPSGSAALIDTKSKRLCHLMHPWSPAVFRYVCDSESKEYEKET